MDSISEKSLKARFVYLDNIRSLVIILVIVVHTAVTYSGIGGWYYREISPENLSALEMTFFGFLISFIQAWSMGLLFFISAFLATKSLNKRGTFFFIKERLFRLGLPLLIFLFIIYPFLWFFLLGNNPENTFSENYIRYIIDFLWIDIDGYASGPLWFVKTLLFFCVIYAIVKKCISKPKKIDSINVIMIILTIVFIGIIAFFVRLIFPIGTSYFNLQLCFFTSYIVLFIAGIIIGENNLLEKLTDKKNIKWLTLTFIIGIPLWAFIMIFGGGIEGKTYYNGGLNWQSFLYALWESFTAVGFSIGIISLFKEKVNIDNKFTQIMRDNAFGIYVFHSPILIAISLVFRYLYLSPILKFAIIAIITFFVCLLFSFFIRKIKPIGLLFK